MQVVEPEDFLGDIAFDQHVGAAGVAAVMQHDAVAGIGELGGQRHELVVAAAPAGDQRRPRAAIPDDLIEDVHSADFCDRHGVSPVIMSAADNPAARLDGHHKPIRRAFQMGLAGVPHKIRGPAPAFLVGHPQCAGLVGRIAHGQPPLRHRLLRSQADFAGELGNGIVPKPTPCDRSRTIGRRSEPEGHNHEPCKSLDVHAAACGQHTDRCVVQRAGAGGGRIAHRLHRAEDRHLRAARHRHAKRLPDVSGRAQRRTRRRQGDVDRRRRPGQAGHRRHQGQQAHPVRQGSHAGRRRAGDDRLCTRAGRDAREDALHRLDRDRRRPRSARLRKISLHGASDLRAVAAEPSARAMGLRARLQADQPHRRRLCLRARDGRRFPEGVRGLRRQDRAENLAADRHQGFRAVHPDASRATSTPSLR